MLLEKNQYISGIKFLPLIRKWEKNGCCIFNPKNPIVLWTTAYSLNSLTIHTYINTYIFNSSNFYDSLIKIYFFHKFLEARNYF